MQAQRTDALGRATFHYVAPRADVRPTAREIRWLKHIERHGPQSSQFLIELTRDTHRCRDTALRDLQKLRAGGFLALPKQQRATERAEFNPFIYDLTMKARDHLVEIRQADSAIRPTGHWWHGYAVSCVTSAIDIAAARSGIRYIPAHKILARNNAPLAIPLGGGRLIPDQLFALDYGGRFRVFALEVDRGTEPARSASTRKSWARSIGMYGRVFERGLHRSHYGLKSNLLALWVFSSQAKEARFLELIRENDGPLGDYVLTQSVASPIGSAADFRAHVAIYEECWNRPDGRTVRIASG